MKKIIFLLFIVGAIYAQQVTENKTVYPNRGGCITQNTNTSNTKTYSYSTETNIGREIVVVDSADTTFNAYRSYFYFNAAALPSNATNISVRVTTITSFTYGFSFTLKKPSTINQSTASTAWDQIRDGVQMLPISISYGTNTNFSSEIQAAFVSSFENGKDFIIAVYNPSDSSETNTKSMFSISLEVTYVRPAVLNSFNVDNIPSGGAVDVDRDGYTFNLQCPGTFTAYENQAISLEAIDVQVIGGLTYGFNDVEGDSNKSAWGNTSAVTGLFEPRTLSQTMSFTGASTLTNLAARLSRFYKMSQRYETELDSTQENQNISYIVKDNSGNVSALSQITINNKLYKYVWWNDNWNLGISRRVTPNNDMTFTAMYKCPSHSNSNLAFSKNSERKVIKSVGEVDALHKVYESMGHVWYERSTDNGNTWTIMNNGKPLDDFQGKNPSIDYYPNYEKVVVAFQNEDVNTGEAQIKVVNFIMGAKVGESYPVTSYLHAYADVNYTPVVAHTVSENICVLYDDDNSEGLFYIIGTVNYTAGTVSWGTAQQVPNTTINDQNPAISGAKGAQIYHFAWQTNDTAIKYQKYYKSGTQWILGTQLTTSSGSGYPKNYNPSITDLNGGARMCWIGEDLGGLTSDLNISPSSNGDNTLKKTNTTITKTVVFKNPDYYRFWNFGSNVQAPSIAKSDDNLAYIIGWNETTTNSNKFVDNMLSDIKNFGATGNYVQVSNAPTKQEMLGIVFSTSSSPYSFSRTNNVGSYYLKAGNIGLSVNYGRQGLVSRDSLQFYFAIGDIIKDEQHVKFIDLPEEYAVNSLEALNYSLVSEPFVINDGETFIYSVQYGMVGNQYAQLSNDKQVNFKVKLIDVNTGEIIKVFDNVTYTGSNLQNYNNILYQVNINEPGSRVVKMCLEVNDNLNGFYTVTDKLNDEDVLAKLNIKVINLVENIEVTSYELFQNYPNPFNPSTTISYQVPNYCRVTLKVFDVLGKEVTTLVDEYKSMGKYDVQFNAKNLASGMYIYQIKAGDFVSSKKLMLMK